MTRFRKTAALLGAFLLIGGGVAGSASGGGVPRTSFEAAALAIPTAAAPIDVRQVRHVDQAMSRSARVSGAANAALDCDGCVGRAASIQVLFAGAARSVVARNVAAVWAGPCKGCRGRAVALQVVVAASAHSVRADNRAFAATAACAGCRVSALALQFVVVDPTADRIGPVTMARINTVAAGLLRDWPARLPRAGLEPAVRSGASAQAAGGTASATRGASGGPAVQDSAGSTGARIADLLRADLQAPVTVSVRVSGG
jgi:hypothetical protein